TNGITAPSVDSQIELERDIYQRHGIDPATISYVETHGTGTKLGDPIELEALSRMFGEWTDRRGFCALGSVKTNIGHTSAAAGVASIHKVLLSMKHAQLPPTLNFKTPNRHFDFEQSPFFVNTDLRPWSVTDAQPRRAAVSSFGFSGTNAHLVIEEYVATRRSPAPVPVTDPVPIILSARRADGLLQVARRLHEFLGTATVDDINLADVSHTLQTGRDAMEERLAFVANSSAEAMAKLEQFLDGDLEGMYRGSTKERDDTLKALGTSDAIEETIELWMRKGALGQILSWWVKGLPVDWSRFPGKEGVRRISLPTYPFHRQRCWFERGAETAEETSSLLAVADKSNLILDLAFPLAKLDPTRAAREFVPRDFEDFLGRLLGGILHSMGMFERPTSSLEELMRAGGVIAKYERWLKEALSGLERSKIIEFNGDHYVLRPTETLDLESLWDQWEERKKIEDQHFAKRKQLPLIEACLRSLPKILTGGVPAVEVLFPGSSVALVEGVYRDNPVSDLFNDILARSFVACLEKR
ncbi:MAG: hypothetical protein NXI02_32875, partial [Rhodobacteraceae bacterium]|nr:hypothetical protein [Paracoccaceae bacterium]